MEVLMWYVLFATTTSLAAMYELFIPVIRELRSIQPKNNAVEYSWITYSVFFLLTLVLAPLVLPSCLIPSFGERFKKSLLSSLSEIYT